MAGFIDSFSYLPETVDIGGDIYFLGPERHINLGFKSRKQFLDTFGTNSKTERLLRKYMNLSVRGKNKLVFDSSEDKNELIKILKKRATILKTSNSFTSSTLKNEIFKRSYLYIQKLIMDLEGSNGKSIKVDDEACTAAKKEIKEISDDHKFQMILEMAWYLLHPDKVPSEIGCDWAKLVKELERLRMGDIVQSIHEAEIKSGIEPSKNALNYFKKINLQTVVKKDTIKNALDQAKELATEIQSETANESVKKRLKLLLDILEMKKYLSNKFTMNTDGMKIISTSEERNTIDKSMITNPMKGGALVIPLGMAMKPLFDYFKVVYDPIYSFLEESIIEYKKTNQIIIPQLTSLLHICNNIKPDTYGVYRITNVDKELLSFIKFMINITSQHIDKFANDVDKNTFNKQVFKLPKVRLSSISDVALITTNKIYKDPTKLPLTQFFVMGANINYLSKSVLKEDTNTAIKDFYNENNIYITYAESEKIPINVYDIDYSKVDVNNNTNKIDNLPNNYFNKNKDNLTDLYFDALLDITQYTVYNDAELALSIFIAFKELMPK
jgi:hypothetical protein